MTVDERVTAELKEAMRAQDKGRTLALRNIRAAFLEKRKENNADTVSDDDALAILRKLAKQRQESIEAYTAGGRDDLVAVEKAELAILEGFLPRLADEATVRGWVRDAITQVGATGMGDLGKVMNALMAAHRGEVDGKLANKVVREALS